MKKIKKFTAVIMTIVMMLTVVPFTGIGFTKAGALDTAGQLSDTISYTFDSSTGTLTISGTGDMPDYNWENSPFYYNSSIESIIVEDGVTSIGDEAFRGCTSLTRTTITDDVTSIGHHAFYECKSFAGIILPDSLVSIGGWAFSNCESLTAITIPASVTSIEDGVFAYCDSLTGLFVDEDNPVYDSRNDCNAIIETETNTLVAGCENTIIPDSVTSIGSYAFNGNASLTEITVPDSVTSIGECAFYYCTRLTEITFSASVTSIDDGAFCGCSSLTDVYYGGTEEEWNAIEIGEMNDDLLNTNVQFVEPDDGRIYLNDAVYYTFDEETGTLTIGGTGDMPNYAPQTSPFFNNSSIKDVIIEDGVTSIGAHAFEFCENLTSVTIPDSVTSIGYYAFEMCQSLKSITIPDGVTSIGEWAFSYCSGFKSITIPNSVTSIGYYAFYYCTGLTSITIPNGVTRIDNSTFYGCKGLTNITIPDSVTIIDRSAFCYCTGLTSIRIPDGVTRIDLYAFYNCTSLKDVYYGGTEENWNATEINEHNESLLNANIHFTEPDDAKTYLNDTVYYTIDKITGTVTISGTGDMPNYEYGESPFYNNCSIRNVIIKDGVTSIGDCVFVECDSLTSITIPDSVTSIGNYAFLDCDSLKNITIPDSVTSIGELAFYFCYSLTNVTIPDSVTSIGDEAFGHCKRLTDIIIPANITSIGYFVGCESLGSITIPASVTSIDAGAFEWCTSLKSITIPDSVTCIGAYAFYECHSLTEITIPNSVTSIGCSAFDGCESLESITIPDGVTEIGSNTFDFCESLESITIPVSVTKIGNSAFDYCKSLTDVYYGGTEEEWNAIAIKSDNNYLLNANIHFAEPADYTDVFSAIESANSLNQNDYTEESWANLIDAIHAVEYDLNCAHQAEVDAMADAINNAIDALDVYIPAPDFTEIDELLEKIAVLDENDYTPESWANLQRAVDAVSALYIGTITQPVVDNAVAALKAAINALEKAHTHTLKHIVVPSTCTVQGMEYDICTGCRKTMNQAVLPLAEHTWGEWVRTLEPTTKAEGVEERTCSVCGAVETRFIEKLNEVVDEKTGISITYSDELAEGVEIDVVEEFDGTSFQILSADYDGNIDFRMFDITPTLDGEKTQPTGTVTVRIPVPAEFNGTDIFVVYVNSENGTTEDMPCTVVDGYVEFQTTHFSHYAICQLIKAVRNVKLSDLTIKHNGKASLNPKITVDDGAKYTVRYESYDTSVADVDKDGTVKAVGSGETIIRCTVKDECGNLFSDTCTVTVEDSFIQHFFRVFLTKLFGEKIADKVMAYFINIAK